MFIFFFRLYDFKQTYLQFVWALYVYFKDQDFIDPKTAKIP